MEIGSQRSQTASHIVDQIKSQGLFDKIRKQCLEDVDVNSDYQVLQKKVNSFVSSFLQNQSWNPGVEKLKLREQLRTRLLSTKMLSCGVDRLVNQALSAKMPKNFKNQVQNIVCDYFDLNPESLLASSLGNQNCVELRPAIYPENPTGPYPTDTYDRAYGSVMSNPVTIPTPQGIQPPFPYPYPSVPVQHSVIQANVPCPINAYVGPSASYLIPPPPPPPSVFCQPLVHFNNQSSVPPQNFHTPVNNSVSPTATHSEMEHVRTQPLEVTVEESVPCDDPMDIESLSSNSPVDESSASLLHENSEFCGERHSSKVSEKSSYRQPNQIAWHDVHLLLDDVSEDEEKDVNSKSPTSLGNSIPYSDHSPVPRSPHTISQSYDRNLSVQNTFSRNVHNTDDYIRSTSPITYDERKHRNKYMTSTLEYNPENYVSNLKTESVRSCHEQKSDYNDSYSTNTSTNRMNHNHTKYSRSSTPPFATSQLCDSNDWCTKSTGMTSRIEIYHSSQSIRRSQTSIKNQPVCSPTSHSERHLSDTLRQSHYTKSPDISMDRRLKSDYPSSSSLSNQFRSSPDSMVQMKMRSNKSYPNITSSCEWARNESHSPEEHSSRSSSMFSQGNYSLSSVSERVTPDPTATSQYPNSSTHRTFETEAVNAYFPDFTSDRLTRKREIEARLKEIESTERKLLNRKKMQSYEKEVRQSTNRDDVEYGPDYRKLPKKYVK
uniref:Biorientation of chromosomes in cell division protein 1 n=1 Tax=Schistosoma mansoni TaxID=6183 RepID=A0A3Q0KLF6_SCHMA